MNNIMIYKKRDAMRQTVADYEEIRQLVQVIDIKELPYIS